MFAELLRGARALLTVRHPLDAEITVSELLSTWQEMRTRDIDPDLIIGEGLLDYARRAATPAALALLTGVSTIRVSARHRLIARRGAESSLPRHRQPALGHLTRHGPTYQGLRVPLPLRRRGRTHLRLPPRNRGRRTVREHALVTTIDHNLGGVLRDAWVSTKVDQLLRHGADQAARDPMMSFTSVSLGRAHTLLTSAIDGLPASWPRPPPTPRFPAQPLGHPLGFIRARPASCRPNRPSRAVSWRRDRRATLARASSLPMLRPTCPTVTLRDAARSTSSTTAATPTSAAPCGSARRKSRLFCWNGCRAACCCCRRNRKPCRMS